jgi:hypothetical protein
MLEVDQASERTAGMANTFHIVFGLVMAILAPVEASILVRILERAGFRRTRTSVRAVCLERPGHPMPVTVPLSGNLQEAVVRQKIRSAGLMPTEYMAYFNVLREEDSSLGR